MKCSRRNFLAGSGALILTTGVAGTSVVSSSLYASNSEQAKRMGMFMMKMPVLAVPLVPMLVAK